MIGAFTLNVSVDRRYVVENSAMNKVNRVKECTASAGGKGLNVARVIHTLGEQVIAGGIAGGNLGRFVCDTLDKEGIAHQFTMAAGETRCCINICDAVTGTQTEYLEPGMTVSPAEYEAFLKDFDDLCARCDVLTISGSLPKGLGSDTYQKLIARAKAAGKPVLLDVSGEALVKGLEAAPYYIKPNEDEIVTLTDADITDDTALAAAAGKLHQQGIERVVVSMGSHGAMMVCDEGVFRGQPPKLEAVNTVGCGDSMTAAFAVAAQRKLNAEESMRFAIAVSAASAMNPGTGGLDMADFDAILPQVKVWKL